MTLAADNLYPFPRPASWLCLSLVVILVASGCQRKLSVPDGLEGGVDPTTEIGASGDVCKLLTPDEVKLALNAPTRASERGGRPILPDMTMCSALGDDAPSPTPGPESSEASLPGDTLASLAVWGLLRKSAEKEFRAYERRNEAYLDSMKVDGHEALWDSRLRTLTILTDKEKAFGVQLKVANPPLPTQADPEERRAYVRQVAEALALRALQRFD